MKHFLPAIIFLFLKLNSFSQNLTPQEIEKDLMKLSSKTVLYYTNNYDSLEKYSALFSEKLTDYVSKYPSTLSYPFKMLIDSSVCRVTTSADGLLRVYSWDDGLGGTMRFYKNIYQYKAQDKIHAKLLNIGEGDPSCFYSEIFTLKADNKTYYLGISNSIFSSKDISQTIKVFTIENNTLNDTVKIIKTKNSFINSISVNFDFFSVVDRPERPVKLIKYDADKKIIYIPIVYSDGKVTDRFILYQFTGKYFEHILTQTKKGQVDP